MTPSKSKMDEMLRNYALDNLRASLHRLRTGDANVPMPPSQYDKAWREAYLGNAAKWATIAEALRPESAPLRYELSFANEETS